MYSELLTEICGDVDPLPLPVSRDELVVVVAVADEQVVDPLLRRLQHTLDERVTEGGQDIRLHSSLGVAVAEDSESAEDVLARADRSTRVSRR